MQSVLSVKLLNKSYGKQQVLDGVNLDVGAGEVRCILGPNGAGKTTLISTVLGLVKEDSGDIVLFGRRQQVRHRSREVRERLGVMMQIGSLSANLSVSEQCDLFSSYFTNGYKATELVELAGLEQCVGQRFGRLSGGQKQRLLFALALAGKPQLIFLDEPTLGMDVEARHCFWQEIQLLKQQGTAVVLTTHSLEEAEQLADQITVLSGGRVVAKGSPEELRALTQYKVISCCTDLSERRLGLLPGVLQVMYEEHKVTLHSSMPDQCVCALLKADPALSQLEVKPVALEHAFLQITRDSKLIKDHTL